MTYDLVIRNARLRSGEIVELAVSDDRCVYVGPEAEGPGQREINAEANLVTETYVIAQLHLDKVLTGDWIDPGAKEQYFHGSDMGGAMTAIELAAAVKERYEETEILERIDAALALAELAGASHIRAFIDVDTKAQLKGVAAALAARDRWRGRVDVQVVAFPQDGIQREPGAEKLLYEAVEMGCDVVGGIPWIEYTQEDMRAHIDVAFDVAQRFDRDVAMLVDDAGDADLHTTEFLATKTLRTGWEGRVSACHARAMMLYSEVYHRKVLALLRRAQMGIVTNPHTGPLHVRVKDLAAAGIPLALGGESINDAYYPYGRCNMLEAAFVSSHTLWMMSPADQQLLYDMTTTGPATIMGIADHRIAAGAPANLVVLAGPTVREAFAMHREPRYVIRGGRVTAETRVEHTQEADPPPRPHDPRPARA